MEGANGCRQDAVGGHRFVQWQRDNVVQVTRQSRERVGCKSRHDLAVADYVAKLAVGGDDKK